MDWWNLLALLPLQSSIVVDLAWLEWPVVVEEKNDPAAFHPYSVAAVVA